MTNPYFLTELSGNDWQIKHAKNFENITIRDVYGYKYKGYPIFKLNPVNSVSKKLINPKVIVGNNDEPQFGYSISPQEETFNYTFHTVNYQENAYLKEFFLNRQGRNKPFWLPSFKSDFLLKYPIKTGDTMVYIDSLSYNLSEITTPNYILLRDNIDTGKFTTTNKFVQRTIYGLSLGAETRDGITITFDKPIKSNLIGLVVEIMVEQNKVVTGVIQDATTGGGPQAIKIKEGSIDATDLGDYYDKLSIGQSIRILDPTGANRYLMELDSKIPLDKKEDIIAHYITPTVQVMLHDTIESSSSDNTNEALDLYKGRILDVPIEDFSQTRTFVFNVEGTYVPPTYGLVETPLTRDVGSMDIVHYVLTTGAVFRTIDKSKTRIYTLSDGSIEYQFFFDTPIPNKSVRDDFKDVVVHNKQTNAAGSYFYNGITEDYVYISFLVEYEPEFRSLVLNESGPDLNGLYFPNKNEQTQTAPVIKGMLEAGNGVMVGIAKEDAHGLLTLSQTESPVLGVTTNDLIVANTGDTGVVMNVTTNFISFNIEEFAKNPYDNRFTALANTPTVSFKKPSGTVVTESVNGIIAPEVFGTAKQYTISEEDYTCYSPSFHIQVLEGSEDYLPITGEIFEVDARLFSTDKTVQVTKDGWWYLLSPDRYEILPIYGENSIKKIINSSRTTINNKPITVLELDSPITLATEASTCSDIDLIQLVRFNSDSLSIKYGQKDMSKATVPITTVNIEEQTV